MKQRLLILIVLFSVTGCRTIVHAIVDNAVSRDEQRSPGFGRQDRRDREEMETLEAFWGTPGDAAQTFGAVHGRGAY